MISDSEIPKCPEFEANSKIGKLFMNEKIFEEYSVKEHSVEEHHKEKIKVHKNGCKYILFRIDVYFIEQFLAVEIDKQNHEGRELILEKKDKKHYKTILFVNLLELILLTQKEVMIQTMKLLK